MRRQTTLKSSVRSWIKHAKSKISGTFSLDSRNESGVVMEIFTKNDRIRKPPHEREILDCYAAEIYYKKVLRKGVEIQRRNARKRQALMSPCLDVKRQALVSPCLDVKRQALDDEQFDGDDGVVRNQSMMAPRSSSMSLQDFVTIKVHQRPKKRNRKMTLESRAAEKQKVI